MLTEVEVNKYKERRAVVGQFEFKKRPVPFCGFAAAHSGKPMAYRCREQLDSRGYASALTGGGASNLNSRNLPESQRLSALCCGKAAK
jgi:hypothetical protein